MKIGIVGPGRSGKDTAAEYLRDNYGLRYTGGTSWYARHIVFDYFERHEPGMYASADACWFDRLHHRQTWADIIGAYNRDAGATTFYGGCLADQDILTGIRWEEEFNEVKALCEAWLYVWRPGYTDRTCKINPLNCDFVLTNGGTLAEFHAKIDAWWLKLRDANHCPAGTSALSFFA